MFSRHVFSAQMGNLRPLSIFFVKMPTLLSFTTISEENSRWPKAIIAIEYPLVDINKAG